MYGLLQWLLASLQHSRGTKEFPSRESQLLVILKFIPSRNSQASGQDGGVGRHTVPPRTTKRQTTTIKKKKQNPELTENRTVWKPDNQRVKEETFIQTSRRGRDGQPRQETHGKVGAGGPGRARLQLVGKATAGRPGEAAAGGASGPTFTCR